MPELLRDILLDATFAPNRAVRGIVSSIDKGVFAPETDLLIGESLRDRLKRERLKRVLVTCDRKVLLDEKHTVGEPKKVGIPVTGLGVDIRYPTRFPHPDNKSKYLALTMHSHAIADLPPSPDDFYTLLLLSSFSTAAAGLLVTTETFDYLVLRGPGAPQWTTEFIEMKKDLWHRNLKERYLQNANPWHTQLQDHQLQNRMQYAQVRQIAKTYDLRVFRSRRGEQILTLEDVWSMAA